MLSNMASSLIMHKRIETTTAKAKALKRYIEPLITRSKEDSTHSRRIAFSFLQDKEAVTELFREISVKVGDRPGGYTRIIRLGNRLGDNADMCMMELVDFNENLLAEKASSKKSASRRRRGAKKKVEEPSAPEAQAKETAVAGTTAVAGAAAVETAVAEEVTEEAEAEAAEVVTEAVVEEEVAEAVVEEEVTEAVVEEEVAEATAEEATPAEEAKEEPEEDEEKKDS
jgi:large subunit ribosomal protein L17